MASGFQQVVNDQPAVGVAGDFASLNQYFSYPAGPGGLVSGPMGCVVGRFAWAVAPADADGTPSQVNNFGSGPVSGFVHREQQGLITHYLEASSNLIPTGFQMGLMIGGDFWVENDGAAQALLGQKAYANFADGKVTFAATGSPTAGGTSTASTIAAETATVTASIVGDTLIVAAQSGAVLVAGALLASGTNVAAGTRVVRQLTSTAAGGALGGTGTYAVSIPEQTVASESMTFSYGLLTIGGTVTGNFGVGDVLSTSGGVTAGTTIYQNGTGAGGAGTYYVGTTQTVGSGAINVLAVNVETKWYAASSGMPGELVKITDHPAG
jgi:hypothetical protein